jgi:hypothetical protein
LVCRHPFSAGACNLMGSFSAQNVAHQALHVPRRTQTLWMNAFVLSLSEGTWSYPPGVCGLLSRRHDEIDLQHGTERTRITSQPEYGCLAARLSLEQWTGTIGRAYKNSTDTAVIRRMKRTHAVREEAIIRESIESCSESSGRSALWSHNCNFNRASDILFMLSSMYLSGTN